MACAGAAHATYPRDIPGPMTGRSMHEIRDELDGLYPNCDAMLADLAGETVVDVGAGYGRFVAELRARDPRLKVYGLDLLAPAGANHFVVANARSLPFADQSITRLFASYTLYLWSREDRGLIAAALRDSFRVLKPGGWLVVIGGDYHGLVAVIDQERLAFDIQPRPLNLLSYLKLTRSK